MGDGEDNCTNIEKLKEVGVIDDWLKSSKCVAVGSGNWIVHRYNKLGEKIVLDSVDEVREVLDRFVEENIRSGSIPRESQARVLLLLEGSGLFGVRLHLRSLKPSYNVPD